MLGLTSESLCVLSVLGVSVVVFTEGKSTTEMQRSQGRNQKTDCTRLTTPAITLSDFIHTVA